MMLTHQWLESFKDKKDKAVFKTMAFNAVSFDCGEADKIPFARKELQTWAMPPYPLTLLQFELSDLQVCHVIILWEQYDAEKAVCLMAFKIRGTESWVTDPPAIINIAEDGKFKAEIKISSDVKDEEVLQTLQLMTSLAKNFFYVLGCSNVITETHPAPQALNKKRAKAGKLPIFEYKTLRLNVPGVRVEGQPLGGTHASPRVHLRRGHVRNLGNGKRVWVQACVVGSNHGMIHKDYKIKTHNQGAQA